MEELYFQDRLAGHTPTAPFDRLDVEKDWDDWPWVTADGDSSDALSALWKRAVHRSREALAGALTAGGLDHTTHSGTNLRRLLADLVEEYARHTGHADLLREQLDGATGEGPPAEFPVP